MKNLDVFLQSTDVDYLVVSFLVHLLSKENVVGKRISKNERLLFDIGKFSFQAKFSIVLFHFLEKSIEERGFTRTNLTDNCHQLTFWNLKIDIVKDLVEFYYLFLRLLRW